ncbi:hypothetical protein R20943_03210 [Paraburkholderia aspalathi]|nr:hypothetical protein R20943_03210 [Paraburkholderia aspalathi]
MWCSFFLRTLKDISPREIRFHNWLDLSRAMVSTRLMNCASQICEVERLLYGHGQMMYGQILNSVAGDPALTRGAIARLIQAGRVTADLDTGILWPGTTIRPLEGVRRVDLLPYLPDESG